MRGRYPAMYSQRKTVSSKMAGSQRSPTWNMPSCSNPVISIYHLAARLLPGRALRPLRLADQESAEPTLRHVRGGGGGGGSAGAGQGHQPQVGISTPPALLSAVYYLPRSAILSCPFGQYSRQRAGPGRVAKPVSIPTVPPAPGHGGMEEDTGTTHTFLFEISLTFYMFEKFMNNKRRNTFNSIIELFYFALLEMVHQNHS